LQGMEEAAGVEYGPRGYVKAGSPTVITYADLCRARHKAAYAEDRIMPSVALSVLVSGG